MRKLMFAFVALFILSLASCGKDDTDVQSATEDTTFYSVSTEVHTNVPTPEIPDVFKVAPAKSREISSLPKSVADVVCSGGPVGGVPCFYVFEEGVTYYVLGASFSDSGEETVLECELSLPDGFESGKITGIEGGGGSGEVFLYVTAKKGDKNALLEYYFYCESVTTPVSVVTVDVY